MSRRIESRCPVFGRLSSRLLPGLLSAAALGMVLAAMNLSGSTFAGERPAPPSLPEPVQPAAPVVNGTPAADAPRIQLAILLDTSGSMQGLINQARTQLWKIVNELATTRQDGKLPRLEVALYEYGKSTIPQAEGYLRQIAPLTQDLDLISAELFALTTNGGEEYCGQVIGAATTGLQWTTGERDLRLIFIAGNEGFDQGSVDYHETCKAAIEKGITVSTIYCGTEGDAISAGWKEGARLADGSYISIDQNKAVAAVATPFDQELVKLSTSLNSTYVAFGKKAERGRALARQSAQDRLSLEAAPAAAAERAKFKGSGQYRASRDLVDAVKNGTVELKKLDRKELPEELQKLDEKELSATLKKKETERAALQKQIQELSQKRDSFLAAARAKEAEKTGKETFDSALLRAVREQATRQGYKVPAQP